MDNIQPKIKIKNKETYEQKKNKSQSILSTLHKKYKTMNSTNLHKYFKENREDWIDYHTIAEENEKSFPEEEIPYNRVIKYLENIPGRRKKTVVDLGCGKARVAEHFKNNKRFEFHNFDHIACNEMVVEKDIRNTELEEYSVDIAILCLAMWGSNCKEYLEEAYRILDKDGRLIIIEAYKRWNEQIEGYEAIENKLVKLLEDNKFTIIKNDENLCLLSVERFN
jgi:ubiquinone/menaquinone biosynthesis C-methylase UbiE